MPRDFQWSGFQFFSRHADTCQARARTGNAARFSMVWFQLFSRHAGILTRVKHVQGLEMPLDLFSGLVPDLFPLCGHGPQMPSDFLQSYFRLFPSPCREFQHIPGSAMPHYFPQQSLREKEASNGHSTFSSAPESNRLCRLSICYSNNRDSEDVTVTGSDIGHF